MDGAYEPPGMGLRRVLQAHTATLSHGMHDVDVDFDFDVAGQRPALPAGAGRRPANPYFSMPGPKVSGVPSFSFSFSAWPALSSST